MQNLKSNISNQIAPMIYKSCLTILLVIQMLTGPQAYFVNIPSKFISEDDPD